MTDDDDVAGLIVELAELRQDVDELRSVRDQLTDVAATVAMVRGQLEDLASDPAVVRPRVVWWPDLDEDEARAAWTDLTAWIDTVLLSRYPEAARVLYPCWREHTEVVDALTALHATWLAAYQNPSAPPLDAAAWLDRWLPTTLGQIKNGLRSCEWKNHVVGDVRSIKAPVAGGLADADVA